MRQNSQQNRNMHFYKVYLSKIFSPEVLLIYILGNNWPTQSHGMSHVVISNWISVSLIWEKCAVENAPNTNILQLPSNVSCASCFSWCTYISQKNKEYTIQPGLFSSCFSPLHFFFLVFFLSKKIDKICLADESFRCTYTENTRRERHRGTGRIKTLCIYSIYPSIGECTA